MAEVLNTTKSPRMATFLVAASDASDKARQGADYVADGTADDVQIQAAIDALPSGGGKVVLSEGTFTMAARVNLVGSIHLEGQGYSTVLDSSQNSAILHADSKTHVRITNLRLKGDTCQGSQAGITFISADDSKVDHIWVDDVGWDGIQLLEGNTRCVVANNHVNNAQDDGINVGGNDCTATSDVTVTGNVVSNSGSVGIHVSQGASDVTVSGNVVTGVSSNGIDVLLGSDGDQRAVITGNIVNTPGNHGISVDGSSEVSEVLVANNLLESVGAQGIRIASGSDRWVVIGNCIFNATTHGIVLSFSSAADRDLLIANNMINGGCSSAGITIFRSTHTLVVGNVITDITGTNSIEDTSTSDNTWVMNNKIDASLSLGSNSVIRNNVGHVSENWGNTTVSPDANGNDNIAHGLDSTPSFVSVHLGGDNVNGVDVQSVGGTNITVRVKDAAGADVSSGSFTVYWEARL